MACERNREPIRQVLAQWLPSTGSVLEISSGTGQHVAYFAEHFPALRWMPSDRDEDAFDSVRSWCEGLVNVEPPRVVDVLEPPDPHVKADAVFNANMIHISPGATTAGLFRWAASTLSVGGMIYLYGPFFEEGVETAPSNIAFDISLKQRHPAWGIRRLVDVEHTATLFGFSWKDRIEMPANNLFLRFDKVAQMD